MHKYLTDRYSLLPIVEKTDFLYTKYNLTPNTITIFNSLIITNFLLYFWLSSQCLMSSLFLFGRLILDGVDGNIARKYKLYTKNGEIYDHMSDSIFLGYIFFVFTYKLQLQIEIIVLLSYTIMILSMLINFEHKLQIVAKKILGAGGSYDGYCTLNYFLAHLIIILIDYHNNL